ncbi:hypothetical protein RND71_022946 [Anisodus tanguticus]|uniref:Uncharacterized protein n=1 Tax=Anisodus tanguticus TaxID=243964 RepID=A0AAE1RUM0_9SOLA|nr:hypothetical protein RND71_022946 [Anisodus tanguticus]
MGKNQTIIKNTQSQGACEKIFKVLNLSSVFRFFSRNPKPKLATTDHHRSDTANATKFKLVAQNGSTNFPLHELKGQQIMPLHENDHNFSFGSNMVLVDYNHNTIAEPMNKFPTDIIATRNHQQYQDLKGVKSEDYNDHSTGNGRFSEYIDHVKNKIISSFDDDDISVVGRAVTRRVSFNDEVSNYIDQSKFKIRTTAIACGN